MQQKFQQKKTSKNNLKFAVKFQLFLIEFFFFLQWNIFFLSHTLTHSLSKHTSANGIPERGLFFLHLF